MGLLNLQQNKSILLRVLVVMTVLEAACLVYPTGLIFQLSGCALASPESLSDTNSDSVTDITDLMAIGSNWLGSKCDVYPGWCGHADVDRNGTVNLADLAILCKNWKHRSLSVRNANNSPTRLAYGPGEMLYVTDPDTGSLFIYDPNNLVVVAELRQLNAPLGIAVDDLGNMYVGCNGTDTVEVYDPSGFNIKNIGTGYIKMPNDLAFDNDGNLYVVDSMEDTVKVFDTNGAEIRQFDNGDLKFPSAIEISYYSGSGEVYVADQGHQAIKVFDLQGNLLRSFGTIITKGMMGWNWQGKFVNIQSLAMDANGRLHVLDSYIKTVQILNPNTPSGVHTDIAYYLDSYGEDGTGPGQIGLGKDIIITPGNKVIMSDSRNNRIEEMYTITIP